MPGPGLAEAAARGVLAPGWRTLSGAVWSERRVDEVRALSIAQRLDLPDVVARVLAARGLSADDAAGFLEPRLRDCLGDPSVLLDLERAAQRLAAAALDGEPVGILADYDVDGATAAALAVRWLRGHGIEAAVEIPCRLEDGYGPNTAALDRLAEQGCQLVLCLDAGTTAFAPLAHAADQGQEVVVVDHHVAQDRLPEAHALVNPHRTDQAPTAYRSLCAAGLTFLLLAWTNRVLRGSGRAEAAAVADPLRWLDLVALGTVCDVVPLIGLNRAFVRQGLKILGSAPNPGLRALTAIAGAQPGGADARRLGFQLGPRINAGGRIGAPTLGVRLLSEDDPREAQAIADRLDQLNTERRRIEQEVTAAALRDVQDQVDAGRAVLVASGEGWHPGVVGIVAARLVERFARPAIVVGIDAAGVGRGSGRSLPGFDLGAAVLAAQAAGILRKAGGHAMAAGLTVEPARLQDLAAFLAERAAAIGPAEPGPPLLPIDAAVTPAGAGPELARRLQALAPFGAGNEEPRLVVPRAQLVESRIVGGEHVACTLAGADGDGRLRAIGFRLTDREAGAALLRRDGPVAVAGRLRLDSWNGQERAQLEIDDVAVPG